MASSSKGESLSKPDMSRGSDRGGSGAWGGAASGASVIDKRGPKKENG